MGEREQKIRWALEGTVSDLVDRQAADDGSGDRGWARAVVALRELELREAPAGDVLPPEGTLAFFHDADHDTWGDEAVDADGSAVLFAPPGTELVPLVPPAETPDDFVRPAAGIRFSDGEGEPAHRLLGEPDPIQHDPLPHARSRPGRASLGPRSARVPVLLRHRSAERVRAAVVEAGVDVSAAASRPGRC